MFDEMARTGWKKKRNNPDWGRRSKIGGAVIWAAVPDKAES